MKKVKANPPKVTLADVELYVSRHRGKWMIAHSKALGTGWGASGVFIKSGCLIFVGGVDKAGTFFEELFGSR